MNLKIQLLKLGKKQTDLLAEIHKRGFPNLYPQQLYRYTNGHDKGKQSQAVMELCKKIIEEWKEEKKKK